MISLKVQSTISMANIFSIGVSSHMIRDASCKNSAVPSCFEKSQKSVSLKFIGKINCEYVVRPPSSIIIATLDVIVANAIKRLDLTCASNAR